MRAILAVSAQASTSELSHTSLRFVRHDSCSVAGCGDYRNGTLGGARRRFSLSQGWRLSGDLPTLGYFAADVCLGNPARTFTLIVDTGSGMTAVPCASCVHCGRHAKGTRFDPGASSTSKPLGCSGCEVCSDGKYATARRAAPPRGTRL